MKRKKTKNIDKGFCKPRNELQQKELKHLEMEFKDYKDLYPIEKVKG